MHHILFRLCLDLLLDCFSIFLKPLYDHRLPSWSKFMSRTSLALVYEVQPGCNTGTGVGVGETGGAVSVGAGRWVGCTGDVGVASGAQAAKGKVSIASISRPQRAPGGLLNPPFSAGFDTLVLAVSARDPAGANCDLLRVASVTRSSWRLIIKVDSFEWSDLP